VTALIVVIIHKDDGVHSVGHAPTLQADFTPRISKVSLREAMFKDYF
jgi:hypothetical protein